MADQPTPQTKAHRELSKIYFLKAGDFVKIGTTKNVSIRSRISDMQTGNPNKMELLGIMLGDERVESNLHAHFSDIRQSGEWFLYSPELKTFIETFAITSPNEINNLEEKESMILSFRDKEVNYINVINNLLNMIVSLKKGIETVLEKLNYSYTLYRTAETKLAKLELIVDGDRGIWGGHTSSR